MDKKRSNTDPFLDSLEIAVELNAIRKQPRRFARLLAALTLSDEDQPTSPEQAVSNAAQ